MKVYNKTILSNGITVITEDISFIESFSLGFFINVGSIDETKSTSGISHFIEHMMFKGTKTRSPRRIAEEIESLGGYLNAFTSKEHTCYYGRGLTVHLEKTFRVLSDMIQNSVFNEKEIEKEANVIVDELYDIEDSPEEIIFDHFEENIFHGNSIAYPIIGTEKNIQSFKRETFLDYIDKNYINSNIVIVNSGNVAHDKIVSFAEKYFNSSFKKKGKKRKKISLKDAKDLRIKKDIQQSHLIIGRPTYGIKDIRRTKISLLSHILGEGSSSRLFQTVREKNGIAYQINSFYNVFSDISAFGVYLSTNEKSIDKAVSLINKEFDKLKNKKISDRELKKAKEYLKGQIIMGLESTTNRMIRIANSELYFGKIRTLEETISEIEEVTSEDILNISNDVLNEKLMSQIIISS
ncbi:MAG: insulinase family protein [Melioribacteraceae bacterium]|nr:insulinase family protein [Melioribacteraceae bacterium]